jgi:high-affinity nickel permease
MRSVLLLGLVIGLRHALEADHLAAVASLSTRHDGRLSALSRGGLWGLGHSATLLAIGGAYWSTG